MQLPINTQTVLFASAGPAEPIVNFETKEPRRDQNGAPMFNVPIFASGGGITESINVKVSGEPKGLAPFTQVKITNLVALTWEMNGQHGVSFRADLIEPAKATV
jgi:hypothetical protein